MSDEPVSLTQDAAMVAFVSLLAAFQYAVLYAAFPERLDANDDSESARLDALSEKIIRVSAGRPELILDSDDAKGTEFAIRAIRQIIADIRDGL